MTTTLPSSTVPATETGIACGACSHWADGRKVTVRHASVAAVRLCQTVTPDPDLSLPLVRMTSLPPVPDAPAVTPVPVTVARAVREAGEPNIPAGRYAVRGTDGVVKFYKIDKPTEGKWAGWTFVKIIAGSEEHPVRNRSARIGILAAILVDVRGASALYGREIGACGVCGRQLTDEESRARGIGPICNEKL